MEACTLLLLLLAVNGCSYVLQPKVSITGLESDTDPRSAWRAHTTLQGAEENAELRAATTNPEGKEIEKDRRREEEEALPLEVGAEKEERERVKEQGAEKEEREGELVAGVVPHEENRDDTHENGQKRFAEKQENAEESKENKDSTGHEEENTEGQGVSEERRNADQAKYEEQGHIVASNVTLSPPTYPLPVGRDIILPSPSVTLPTPATTNQARVLNAGNAEDELVSLVEDDLTEVHKMMDGERNGLVSEVSEVKVGPTALVSISSKKSEDTTVTKHKLTKSALNELEATYTVKGISISSAKLPKTKKTNAVVPPKENKFRAKAANPRQPDPTAKSKESNSIKPTPQLKTLEPTGKPAQAKATENNKTEPNLNLNKTSPPKPKTTTSIAKPLPTQSKAAKVGKAQKSNKNKKGKKKDKPKVKKGKKGNKTKKPSKKKQAPTPAPTDFPFFKDNYCPAECACYGRVVQCSDKGVEKVPYGIPYNARYILLMNNHIDGVQLDLLNEYLDMEFLVLSNNRLTDATIEGAFEGIHALRRLYLDRNLLESVPGDLPASLEELRLDNNRVRVMSEAVWARCPGLLVLSLSNNSLGNESETLADGVLAPLGNLRTLNLDGNQLAAVPLGLPVSIKELYLRGNRIQRFRAGAFNGTAELLVLDLSANRLTNRGLVRESLLNVAHLESLNLEGNRLKQVPRHLPSSIKTLNLEGNLISSIGQSAFLAMPNLEHLGLARNKISRVAPGAFRPLPVLHQLDLCHNALRQVPRQLPRSLYSAALTHNKIQSVPRDAFCWGQAAASGLSGLVRVQLEHNLIDLGNIDTQAFRCLRGFQVVHFF